MSALGSPDSLLLSSSGYEIQRSLRFNDDDTAYLSRTPSSAGNRKTWTWSGWVKKTKLAYPHGLFSADNTGASNSYFLLTLNNGDDLSIFQYTGSAYVARVATSAKLRDTSAWYHIVLAMDTTQATPANRVKFYINGIEQTSFRLTEYPAQDLELYVNAGSFPHSLGSSIGGLSSPSDYLDGYLAEVNFIDGSALDPTDFGETDTETGAWIPKKYSGSYGTNGFYLNFSDNSSVSALGTDTSGNGNNWTPNNFSVNDCGPDSPTNNFCTLNPLDRYSSNNISTSEGNLEWANSSGGSYEMIRSTQAMQSGKWYAEYVVNSQGGTSRIFGGIVSVPNASLGGYLGQSTTANSYGYAPNGTIYFNGSSTATGTTYTTGDVIGLALNLDDGEINFYKNNTYITQKTGLSGYYAFGAHAYNTSDNGTFNFGQDSSFAGNKTTQGNSDGNGVGDFYYTPPAGYLALCTANLPVPTIKDGTDYFNTVLYTGDDSVGRAITVQDSAGSGWQPDFVWVKARNQAYSHHLYDSVRGASKRLLSNGTQAEFDQGSGDGVTAFNPDGFDVSHTSSDVVNQLNTTYVAWNWLAGGSTESLSTGTITSTVSRNVDAGFSIVTWAGSSVNASTIGHGLGVAPSIILTKSRSNASSWIFGIGGMSGFGVNDYFNMQTTGAKSSSTTFYQAYGTDTFTVGVSSADEMNKTGNNYVSYCFAEVEGFSKFGSYTGNGSTDGPFVFCGFRPAMIWTKRADGTSNWYEFDDKRNLYNLTDNRIELNSSAAEFDGYNNNHDLLSNGFKLRSSDAGSNGSGGTYIFAAWAVNPFKYSNAR